jgi:hypothetical protein
MGLEVHDPSIHPSTPSTRPTSRCDWPAPVPKRVIDPRPSSLGIGGVYKPRYRTCGLLTLAAGTDGRVDGADGRMGRGEERGGGGGLPPPARWPYITRSRRM